MRVKELDIVTLEEQVALWASNVMAEPNTMYDIMEWDLLGIDAYIMWIFERDINGKPSLSYSIVHESCDVYSAPQELDYWPGALDEPEAFHQFEADFYSWADTIDTED